MHRWAAARHGRSRSRSRIGWRGSKCLCRLRSAMNDTPRHMSLRTSYRCWRRDGIADLCRHPMPARAGTWMSRQLFWLGMALQHGATTTASQTVRKDGVFVRRRLIHRAGSAMVHRQNSFLCAPMLVAGESCRQAAAKNNCCRTFLASGRRFVLWWYPRGAENRRRVQCFACKAIGRGNEGSRTASRLRCALGRCRCYSSRQWNVRSTTTSNLAVSIVLRTAYLVVGPFLRQQRNPVIPKCSPLEVFQNHDLDACPRACSLKTSLATPSFGATSPSKHHLFPTDRFRGGLVN